MDRICTMTEGWDLLTIGGCDHLFEGFINFEKLWAILFEW